MNWAHNWESRCFTLFYRLLLSSSNSFNLFYDVCFTNRVTDRTIPESFTTETNNSLRTSDLRWDVSDLT